MQVSFSPERRLWTAYQTTQTLPIYSAKIELNLCQPTRSKSLKGIIIHTLAVKYSSLVFKTKHTFDSIIQHTKYLLVAILVHPQKMLRRSHNKLLFDKFIL